jgi:hypothetical protein
MPIEVTLEDVRSYARCSLEWFWERRAGLARPQTIAALYPAALRQAVSFYYDGHAPSLSLAAVLVWRDWCESWEAPHLLDDLNRYAHGRNHILGLFTTGKVTRPGGGAYTAPQLTKEYRVRMHNAGLSRLGGRLDEFARLRGLLPEAGDRRPGSALGDVFADCQLAAERMGPNLPAREVVLGSQVAYHVELANTFTVAAHADLLAQAPADGGEPAVQIEVHDFDDQPWVRAGVAGRDLRVIAALLARPPASQAHAWERVAAVIYRHWRSGQSFTFREANSGHLLAVLSAVVRGMDGGCVIPRALTGFEACRGCAYHEQCWNEAGWRSLALLDAGTLQRAEQVRTVMGRVRQALVGDSQSARGMQAALQQIEEAVSRLPDRLSGQAVLNEANHLAEALAHG